MIPVLQTKLYSAADSSDGNYLVSIDSADFSSFSQSRMYIEIPISGIIGSDDVRLVSFLYRDLTGLLPGSITRENRYVIIYPITRCNYYV